MRAKDLMTRDVITITPESSLKDACKILREKRISGLPVIDASGHIVGIVTVTDIMRIIGEIYKWQILEKTSTGLNLSDLVGKERLNTDVKNVMTKNVYSVDEDKDIGEVLRLIFTHEIHTIPVTKDGLLAGVIGKRDIVYGCF